MRLPHAGLHALAGLAAIARGDAQVGRHAVDREQRLEAVAGQRGAAHRARDLAVLDQVALGDAEHEVAGGGLHLAAAEGDRVEAALHALDQLLGGGVALAEVGVGHARHRQVAERLAPAVAGGRHAVLAGAQQVVEVGGELAALDHGGLLGGRALVVDAVGAPLAGLAAVVVGDQPGLGELLAQLPRVHARALLDRVRLQAVPHGLVQQHAPEAVAHHNRHATARGVDRVEHGQRLARGRLGHLLRIVGHKLEPRVATAGLAAGLGLAVATRDYLGAEPHAGAVVGRADPVRVEDLHAAPRLHIAHGDLGDLGSGAAGRLVAGTEQLGLRGGVDVLGALPDVVRLGGLRRPERLRLAPVA